MDDSIEGVISISVGPSEDYVEISLMTSPQYFLPLKRITFETFGLGIEEIENDYVCTFEKIGQEAWEHKNIKVPQAFAPNVVSSGPEGRGVVFGFWDILEGL